MKSEWWEEDTSDLRKELGLVTKVPEPLPERAQSHLVRLKQIQNKKPTRLEDLPRLLTLPEVYARCKISHTRFYILVKQGVFKPVKSGRRTLVPEDQVLKHLLDILGYEKKTKSA